MTQAIELGEARLDDQGRIGPLLIEVLGPVLRDEAAAAQAAGIAAHDPEEELMAADDWIFSSVDGMNCCMVARADGDVVGVAVANPYVSELMYVAVRTAYRRQGIGSRLVKKLLVALRERGQSELRMELPRHAATAGADAFFRHLGFGAVRARETFGVAIKTR